MNESNRLADNVVTLDDTRSGGGGAGVPEKCFYCAGQFGEEHESHCVCIRRPVKIRWTIEFIVPVVRGWSRDQIEFHYNESSSCKNNLLSAITERFDGPERCACER